MNAIPLGLISSIIFSIVLAKNSSDSGSTTGCFPFCRKKTKKGHKTADEPVKGKDEYDPDLPNLKFIDEFDPIILEVPKGRQSVLGEPFISETDGIIIDKVTGFSRRKNNSSISGWYVRPYEEDYEDMINFIFTPLNKNDQYFQSNQTNAHKQGDASPPVPKTPGKQELPEEPKLSTINEDDAYALHEYAKLDEEMPEKFKQLLCTNPKETKQADELMNEAVTHLEYHATSEDGYKLFRSYPDIGISCYKKKHDDHTDVLKIHLKIDDLDMYNETINQIWIPNSIHFLYKGLVKIKIARVYKPNLLVIQQRCKDSIFGRWEYFHALAKKTHISEDKTIIVMTSPNIIDHHPSTIEYKNTIIENANLFTIEIDSKKDIRKGKWKKKFVNIAGFLIEKKIGYVSFTYVESINEHGSI
ncbi:fam-a protein [Plasmodium chabaudi chabaudi]|uniref:Fam-a protein n=1 Tax=Plasmodium chabaudi chabaudi TaxID=31271 RepID=A0A077TKZ0_PLACU|nr:fam-a protein [Plasmodium chabaudi chabaudi]SCL90626.1 fam-a protein [Plasmodium chabaudi chabaudi]SCN60774.1 fam-a protein [Plasmodium chabaudi chabaudi]VTZ69000.1 fam-a protein [Plasmodium chabaudi chabaudi]|eukprot:XP_016653896.1 fam-a protein [Plasmodium chabaudi chabaudi]